MSTPEQAHEVWMENYSQARCYDGSVEAAGSPANSSEKPEMSHSRKTSDTNPPPKEQRA